MRCPFCEMDFDEKSALCEFCGVETTYCLEYQQIDPDLRRPLINQTRSDREWWETQLGQWIRFEGGAIKADFCRADASIAASIRSVQGPSSQPPEYRTILTKFLSDAKVPLLANDTIARLESRLLTRLRDNKEPFVMEFSDWDDCEEAARQLGEKLDSGRKSADKIGAKKKKWIAGGLFLASAAVPVIRGAATAIRLASPLITGAVGWQATKSSGEKIYWFEKAGPMLVRVAKLRRKLPSEARG